MNKLCIIDFNTFVDRISKTEAEECKRGLPIAFLEDDSSYTYFRENVVELFQYLESKKFKIFLTTTEYSAEFVEKVVEMLGLGAVEFHLFTKEKFPQRLKTKDSLGLGYHEFDLILQLDGNPTCLQEERARFPVAILSSKFKVQEETKARSFKKLINQYIPRIFSMPHIERFANQELERTRLENLKKYRSRSYSKDRSRSFSKPLCLLRVEKFLLHVERETEYNTVSHESWTNHHQVMAKKIPDTDMFLHMRPHAMKLLSYMQEQGWHVIIYSPELSHLDLSSISDFLDIPYIMILGEEDWDQEDQNSAFLEKHFKILENELPVCPWAMSLSLYREIVQLSWETQDFEALRTERPVLFQGGAIFDISKVSDPDVIENIMLNLDVRESFETSWDDHIMKHLLGHISREEAAERDRFLREQEEKEGQVHVPVVDDKIRIILTCSRKEDNIKDALKKLKNLTELKLRKGRFPRVSQGADSATITIDSADFEFLVKACESLDLQWSLFTIA